MATALEFVESLLYLVSELKGELERNECAEAHGTLDLMESDIETLRRLIPADRD